jgi:hypothetical protein
MNIVLGGSQRYYVEYLQELALVKDYPNLPVVIASGYGALNIEFLLPALEPTLAEAATIGQRV